MMDYSELAARMVDWLRERVKEAGAKGVVFGLSGGIDSAVVAALSYRAFETDAVGLIMPCHSIPRDREDALLVARHLGLRTYEVDLGPIYDLMVSNLSFFETGDEKKAALARANMKPRLRMITLYSFAQNHGYLVAGTGNRSELTVGYFTKHGDSGVDLLPLSSLVKTQVRELARYLGIPQPIIDKPPSAGLWEGQTDEKEMGITYEELDRYILGGEVAPVVRKRIEQLHGQSQHKRMMPYSFQI